MVSRNNFQTLEILVMISLSFTIKAQTLNISYDNIAYAANDYGGIIHNPPLSVAYPKSVDEISNFIRLIFNSSNLTNLTIAARGNGHSTRGQAQAYKGIVFDMTSLAVEDMKFHIDDMAPYVDVSAGTFWKSILNEGVKHGYAPKAWTDYLYLTVGGTLSNGGIGGQAFRHGPQIDNVLQLQVVTGKGEIHSCSREENSDLFYAVLGGLGQFGIITRARISLEPIPRKVKWIKALYNEINSFSKDLEHLIALEDTFDYVEGFILLNQTSLREHNNSGSSTNLKTTILFELEVAKYYNENDTTTLDEKLISLTSQLNYIRGSLCTTDATYVEFLDRVHTTELELMNLGLWDAPHPWLNLLVPKSGIKRFVDEVFGNIINETVNGPILIFPVNKQKWENKTSLVTPDEDIFYIVAFLYAAPPLPIGKEELDKLLSLNKDILNYCKETKLGVKQYLPYYTTQQEWKEHFGPRWVTFVGKKYMYDPLEMLEPGQMIFQKGIIST